MENSSTEFMQELENLLEAENQSGENNALTEAWKKARLGKFTSSSISKLTGKGMRKMTPEELEEAKAAKIKRTTVDTYFSETAITYIDGRIGETLTQEANELSSAAIKHGEEYEEDAVKMFEKLHSKEVEHYGKKNPVFLPYAPNPEHAGGSPDGFIKAENAVVEVKCPYESKNHVRVLIDLARGKFDLKEFNSDYYGQVQFNMYLSGEDCRHGYFVSYDPRVVDFRYSIAAVRIERDDEYIKNLIERLDKAIEEKIELLTAIGYYGQVEEKIAS